MNKFRSYLAFLLLFSLKSTFALVPNINLTPQNLGYTGTSSIVYFEKIDDEYLGLVVEVIEDGKYYYASWAYNIESKKAIELDRKSVV